MNIKTILKTIAVLPLLMAGAYAVLLLSYIIMPLILVGIVSVVAYAVIQVMDEDKDDTTNT